MMYHVCIVEDDRNMLNIIRLVMEASGFRTSCFGTFEEAREHVGSDYDVWLLDIMLKKESGRELFKIVKQMKPDMPIIFISARDKEVDRILGLELGSDDYITKPFSKKELVLRVNNVLRRAGKAAQEDLIQLGEYCVDRKHGRVEDSRHAQVILTGKEYALLNLFLDNMGQIVERERLLKVVWDINYYGSGRVLDDTVRRLRKKMPDLKLETVYGLGYRLNAL